MGNCQNYGPFLGPCYNTGPNLGDPKRDHNFDSSPHRTQRFVLGVGGGSVRQNHLPIFHIWGRQ